MSEQPVGSPLSMHDPPTVGPWTLESRLGAGGMGVVFYGRAPGQGAAAIKVIRPGLLDAPATRDRFRREVAILRSVRDVHISEFLSADLESEPAWLAIEYVSGPILRDEVLENGPLAEDDWWDLARGLAQALAVLDVHRSPPRPQARQCHPQRARPRPDRLRDRSSRGCHGAHGDRAGHGQPGVAVPRAGQPGTDRSSQRHLHAGLVARIRRPENHRSAKARRSLCSSRSRPRSPTSRAWIRPGPRCCAGCSPRARSRVQQPGRSWTSPGRSTTGSSPAGKRDPILTDPGTTLVKPPNRRPSDSTRPDGIEPPPGDAARGPGWCRRSDRRHSSS